MTLPHRNHYTEIIVVLHKPSVSFHFTGILVQEEPFIDLTQDAPDEEILDPKTKPLIKNRCILNTIIFKSLHAYICKII